MQHKKMPKEDSKHSALYNWRKVKVFLAKRDTFIFLFFLCMSAIFWLIISLNKTYETRVSIPLTYLNAPADIELMADLPTHIVAKIKDKGTSLIGYSEKSFNPLVINFADYDFSANNSTITISTASTFDKEVKEQLDQTTQILDYLPGTILIEKKQLGTKRIPVKPQTNITYAKQYYPAGNITVMPDSVTLYGSQEALDTIRFIKTQLIEVEEVNDTLTTQVSLIDHERTKAKPETVTVTIPTEFYTEGKQLVPVKVLGVPKNMHVRTFPSEVEVTYLAGFSRFKAIIPADFLVTIQYNDLISSSTTTQAVELEKYPSYVVKPKLKTDKVQWVIEFIE